MIRANVGPCQGTGVHNDRILPDLQGQPQRNSFSYNSQTLSVQEDTENKQSIQSKTSDGTEGGNYRDKTQRIGQMLESNFQSTETGRRMEKDPGCNSIEQRDPTFTFLKAGSGGCQNDNFTNGLDDQTRPKTSIPPFDSHRTTQTISSIRSGENVQQILGNALKNPTLTKIFHGDNELNLSRSQKDMGFVNNKFLGRYSPITLRLDDPESTNNSFDRNIRKVWSDNLVQEMRAGTETRDNVLKFGLEFSNNGTIYAERQKINELGFTEEISKNNFSTNMNSERTRMVLNDEITDASTARDGMFPPALHPIFRTNSA
ncbi:MAG: hypothetical protein EZS28_003393 [Streblomastix strix]|uniref:Uncharacterized protein n=1 Tax=Streblomastix strix TaxID=222440 RepID=A0A5J4X2V0_9EUKA|nr:MAG: hypothetical protein EZS28_003393 [Streblomastix strix]